MNKTKLILRSLLLMLILWAVNAIVLKWPVHLPEEPINPRTIRRATQLGTHAIKDIEAGERGHVVILSESFENQAKVRQLDLE